MTLCLFFPQWIAYNFRLHGLNISTSVEVVDHTNVKYYNFGVTRLAWHRFGCISSLKHMLEEACSHWWVQQNLFGAEEFVFKNWFDLGTRLPITSSAIEFVSFDGLYIQGELG